MTRFNEFWLATAEPSFESFVTNGVDCCRLVIDASRDANHCAIRLQRSQDGADAYVLAPFYQHGTDGGADCSTYKTQLDATHWAGLHSLLDVCRFWQMPIDNNRYGLDGVTYTFDVYLDGRQHRVVPWSPDPVASRGELFCVVTDYLERLAMLAAYDCKLHKRYG
ncbi:MAG: hypothetical protein AAFU85_11820 [Planctomycetota bacterium]